jgi:hypothetical protein
VRVTKCLEAGAKKRMSLNETSESEAMGDQERRSSVRARALLPCKITRIAESEIPALESRILDIAVVDDERSQSGLNEWGSREEDLPRGMATMLKEIRALRGQLAEIQREVEVLRGDRLTGRRWLVLNDRGLWVPHDGNAELEELQSGDFVEVRMRLPTTSVSQVLAMAEVLRVREGERGGVALEFRAISQIHSKAIIQYALRRERQLARSKLFSGVEL